MERRLLLLVQLIISFEWLRSGWEKVSNKAFVPGMGKTLGVFAAKNPHAAYKSFLTGYAIPHSAVFGVLTSWGEVLTGIGLGLTALMLIFNKKMPYAKFIAMAALVGSLLMNANYWMAAGWISPSNDGSNITMFLVAAVLLCAWLMAFKPAEKPLKKK